MRQLIGFLALAFVLSACGGGDNGEPVVEPQFDGSRPAVEDIYSRAQLDALESIGLTLNLGNLPPNIEGTFRVEPVILQASTVPEDAGTEGTEFSAATITFSNQNNTTLQVDLNVFEDVGAETSGIGSFISGQGQSFTVYFITESTINGEVADTTITYSGVVTDVGIENIQYALFMLDDRGDVMDLFIPNDSGRLFFDLDGFSERVSGGSQKVEAATQQASMFQSVR